MTTTYDDFMPTVNKASMNLDKKAKIILINNIDPDCYEPYDKLFSNCSDMSKTELENAFMKTLLENNPNVFKAFGAVPLSYKALTDSQGWVRFNTVVAHLTILESTFNIKISKSNYSTIPDSITPLVYADTMHDIDLLTHVTKESYAISDMLTESAYKKFSNGIQLGRLREPVIAYIENNILGKMDDVIPTIDDFKALRSMMADNPFNMITMRFTGNITQLGLIKCYDLVMRNMSACIKHVHNKNYIDSRLSDEFCNIIMNHYDKPNEFILELMLSAVDTMESGYD